MRISLLSRLSILASIAIIIFSCNKKEDFQSEPLSDYFPLSTGKYITYRVDSTVFTNFGRSIEIHKYQVKHVIEAELTDNLGRPSFRVYRYIRDTTGTQPWQSSGSYWITPLTDQVEVIEDNMRVIKMHMPLKNGFSWKGNGFLATDPYGALYNFSSDDDMAEWDFYYDGEPETTVSIGGQTYNDVYTVQQENFTTNFPITDPNSYAAQSFSVEKFAKNIGLVYRELILWEQQPNPSGNPPNVTYDPYKIGFGIKMWMIDHN